MGDGSAVPFDSRGCHFVTGIAQRKAAGHHLALARNRVHVGHLVIFFFFVRGRPDQHLSARDDHPVGWNPIDTQLVVAGRCGAQMIPVTTGVSSWE